MKNYFPIWYWTMTVQPLANNILNWGIPHSASVSTTVQLQSDGHQNQNNTKCGECLSKRRRASSQSQKWRRNLYSKCTFLWGFASNSQAVLHKCWSYFLSTKIQQPNTLLVVVFRVMTLCSLVDSYQCSAGTYHLCLLVITHNTTIDIFRSVRTSYLNPNT